MTLEEPIVLIAGQELAQQEALRIVEEWMKGRLSADSAVEAVRSLEPPRWARLAAELQEDGVLESAITTCYDGALVRAGFQDPALLRGSATRLQCTACGAVVKRSKECPSCGSRELRLDVILEGERVHQRELVKALLHLSYAKTVIVAGFNDDYYPAVMLPWIASFHGARVLWVEGEEELQDLLERLRA